MEKNRTHLYDFMPRICETKSVKQTSQVIENFMFQYQKGNGFKAGIFYDDNLVGIAGLKYVDSINKKTELMYWIDYDYSGKGIISDVVAFLLEVSFNVYKLNKVSLVAAEQNLASIRVAEKNGFKLEGVLKQHELLPSGFSDCKSFFFLKCDYGGEKRKKLF